MHQIFQLPTTPDPQAIEQPDAGLEIDPLPTQDDGVQIAGVGTQILKRVLQGGAKTSKRLDDVIEEGATAGALNKNYAIVREASDDEVAEFDRLIGKTEGVPSPTPGQKAQGIPAAAVFVSSDAATCFCRPPD